MKDYLLELTGKLLDFLWIVGGSNTFQQIPEASSDTSPLFSPFSGTVATVSQ